jgi:hypothetical protein
VALISGLISALLSGPTISSPDFYLLLAILIAATANVEREAAHLWRTKLTTGLARSERISA